MEVSPSPPGRKTEEQGPIEADANSNFGIDALDLGPEMRKSNTGSTALKGNNRDEMEE